MGGACAPIRSPPGIPGTGYPARVYPEAWQAGKAPVGRSLRQRPGPPAQHRPGIVGHLRGGFFAVLIWRMAGTGAHHALATLNEVIAGGEVSWVLEADLKNFLEAASYCPRAYEVRSNSVG